MIDAAMIRENFANMLDSQLIKIAEEEGHELTPEALKILAEEFKKRGLDEQPIETAEQTKVQIHEEKIQQVKNSLADEFLKMIWKYTLEEKQNGTTGEAILSGLQERGLDEEHSRAMINSVPDKLKALIDEGGTQSLWGAFIFFAGIGITAVTYTTAVNYGGTYFIAWGAIVFGAIRFLRGNAEKSKYKAILENITSNQITIKEDHDESSEHRTEAFPFQ